jgi:hypothetical protein
VETRRLSGTKKATEKFLVFDLDPQAKAIREHEKPTFGIHKHEEDATVQNDWMGGSGGRLG